MATPVPGLMLHPLARVAVRDLGHWSTARCQQPLKGQEVALSAQTSLPLELQVCGRGTLRTKLAELPLLTSAVMGDARARQGGAFGYMRKGLRGLG